MRSESARPYHLAIAAVVAALGVSGCTAAGNADEVTSSSPSQTVPPTPAVPVVVDVTCGPTGTVVSTTRVAAQPDGVHLRVRATSGEDRVHLAYAFQRDGRMAPAGGDVVGPGATSRVYAIPPGPAHLQCVSGGGGKDTPVSVEVLDPGAAWRTGALAAIGCMEPKRSLVDWIFRPGRGATSEAALKALVRQLPHAVTWRHVQEGYVAAQEQVYVFDRDGKPWVTVSVHRWSESEYEAGMGAPCGDALGPTRRP